jgi:hypothetical protein
VVKRFFLPLQPDAEPTEHGDQVLPARLVVETALPSTVTIAEAISWYASYAESVGWKAVVVSPESTAGDEFQQGNVVLFVGVSASVTHGVDVEVELIPWGCSSPDCPR